MSSPSKRRDMDLMKLMMSDYKVEMMNDGMQEFFVEFRGPKDSNFLFSYFFTFCKFPHTNLKIHMAL
ncbi:hypothetical protein Ahy_A03g012638 isoform C [Arachis hypogaea]|uniref:Uncharacterized protein n=1 Tax=Arachis hypogaea TaxID=3818 RepID=A0A445DU27_ARAHY|nr:hypothetical protein Ahy_A03g012638 isoform C [Arachis hypogaea]